MSDNRYQNPGGKPKKKKSAAGSFFSWFFSIILIALVAVIVVVLFIAPVSKIKAGEFDVSAITIGDTTVGEILGDSDITVFELLQTVNKIKTISDADITQTPAESDIASAVQTIKEMMYLSETDPDPTEEQIGQTALYIVSGNTPSDTTGIKKLYSFTDKELAYILNCGLQQAQSSLGFAVELNQLEIKNDGQITVSAVMTVDVSKFTDELPESLSFLKFEELRIFSDYEMTVAGTLTTTSAATRIGSLSEEDTQILLNILQALASDEVNFQYMASSLFTNFVNNLGYVGSAVDSLGAGGITDHSISVVVSNT